MWKKGPFSLKLAKSSQVSADFDQGDKMVVNHTKVKLIASWDTQTRLFMVRLQQYPKCLISPLLATIYLFCGYGKSYWIWCNKIYFMDEKLKWRPHRQILNASVGFFFKAWPMKFALYTCHTCM